MQTLDKVEIDYRTDAVTKTVWLDENFKVKREVTTAKRYVSSGEYVRLFYADVVRLNRQLAGWTQAELAEKAGTTQKQISWIENGKWKSIRVMQKVLRQFNLNFKIDLIPNSRSTKDE